MMMLAVVLSMYFSEHGVQVVHTYIGAPNTNLDHCTFGSKAQLASRPLPL